MADNTLGFMAVAGAKKAATWGTPVLVSTLNGFELGKDNLGLDVQLVENRGLIGSAQQREADLGKILVAGDIEMPAKYESLGLLWALLMGTAGTPTQLTPDTAYKHVLKPKNDLLALFATLVIDYQVEVHEYASFKIGGCKLECSEANQEASVTFRGAAHSLACNTSSGTNKTSTISGITMAANRYRLLFPQMVVRLNDQSGAALSSSDNQYVTGIMLDVDRSLKQDMVTTKAGRYTDEPLQNGFTKVTGSLQFDKYASANLGRMADYLAATAKKMSIVFTGPLCNGSSYYSMTFYLNNVQFSKGRPNIGGAELTPWTVDFVAHLAAAAPTGFPVGYTDALTIELVNGVSADLLA